MQIRKILWLLTALCYHSRALRAFEEDCRDFDCPIQLSYDFNELKIDPAFQAVLAAEEEAYLANPIASIEPEEINGQKSTAVPASAH